MDYNVTYRKKDKAWQAIISYKVGNKWKQKSKQGFKNQKDAKPFIKSIVKKLESSVDNNIDSNYGRYSFKEVTEMYIEHISLYREFNTIKGYKNCFSIFSDFNVKKIDKISCLDIQQKIDSLVRKNLGSTTITIYLRRLNTFFKYVRNDLHLIAEIPTQGVQKPKGKSQNAKKALNKKELEDLMKNLKNNKFYIVAYIAANTGLRLSEILGLTWNDINFKDSTISVNKQWKILKNGNLGFGTLKSKNSFREVPISTKVALELKKYKRNNLTDINNRVAPFTANNIFKHLNPELHRLAGISIHELRHTYATMLISNDIDFKTAASILGHDVKQTMKTYSHVNDDMLKKAKNVIQNIF